MLFRNKKTGLIWEIVDEDHIQRLKNDDDYEVVKEKEQSKQPVKKSPTKKG
ncbi:hypothetical protein HPJ92_01845 [Anoxybacillus flavithermus]|uniref:hypothetical protein n=1 Tax=Anoxybacillus flavithermus TaxID=33934 RepID=UPI0018673B7C|nr:hypothetical protein [Anoxybacillus flavithermus]MBE2931301.1 hypothetical protein [Anoxybacillus flavithermus]